MKHLTFTAGLFAIAAMAVSCQKEQSELHLDTLPSTAVITGTVEYVVGDYQLEDESVVSDYSLPAVGQTVMVTIPTSDYASNADGNQYFEAVTDDNGQYRIEIPISMNSLNATLSVLPFYAKKDFAQDDLSMVSIENALYNNVAAGDNTRSLTVNLEQKKIYTANLVVSSDAELPVAFDQPVEIKGLATVEAWVRDNDQDSDSEYYWTAGTNVLERREITVVANVNGTTITAITTTNNDGEYELTMNLPTNCWDNPGNVRFTASTSASIESDFQHHYCYEYGQESQYPYETIYRWATQDLDVIYESANASANLSDNNRLVPVEISNITVQTKPADSSITIYGVNEYTTSNGNNIPSRYNNLLRWN